MTTMFRKDIWQPDHVTNQPIGAPSEQWTAFDVDGIQQFSSLKIRKMWWIMGIIRQQSAVEVDGSENETNLQMGFYQQCSATTNHWHSPVDKSCTTMWTCFSETGSGKISNTSSVESSLTANCERSVPFERIRLATSSSGLAGWGSFNYQDMVSRMVNAGFRMCRTFQSSRT